LIGLSSTYLRPRPTTLAAAALAFALGWTSARVTLPSLDHAPAAPSAAVVPLKAPVTAGEVRPHAAAPLEARAAPPPEASPSPSAPVAPVSIPPLWPPPPVGFAALRPSPSILPPPARAAPPPAAAPPVADTAGPAAAEAETAGPETDVASVEPAAQAIEVRKGDTLLGILMRAGVDRAEAHEAIETLKGVYDPHALRVGQALEVSFVPSADSETSARLASLSLGIDPERDLRLVRGEDGSFAALTVDRPLHHETAAAQGVISTSLYDSARAAGMPPETIASFVKLLSWDVDFQRDIHPGHRFETLYERAVDETGRIVRSGELLYGRLELDGRSHAVYRFERADGQVGYYDPSGRSARKSLLRTPIDGARLTSGFGMRRHPILGFSRMHKGIDFAAPIGTPVYAAGDGVVEVAGRHAAYGKYVRIRHNSVYATAYAHLSRYGQGIQAGRRVAQGQLIGYVGTTGLSTGPHLHYEILERGRQVNPLKVRQDVVEALTGRELQRFVERRDAIDRMRQEALAGTEVAQAGEDPPLSSPAR
jgi:murein DD-endopeptidase MepM/ murein hydrolase activator NlpD